MKVSTLLAAAGAVFVLSAGSVTAAEVCECCKDMAADAAMTCCDKMKDAATPAPAPGPGPESTPAEAPDHSQQDSPT